jgi:hypothetical protein
LFLRRENRFRRDGFDSDSARYLSKKIGALTIDLVVFSTAVATFLSTTFALRNHRTLETRKASLREAVDSCADPSAGSQQQDDAQNTYLSQKILGSSSTAYHAPWLPESFVHYAVPHRGFCWSQSYASEITNVKHNLRY